jgi:hypothetical protein
MAGSGTAAGLFFTRRFALLSFALLQVQKTCQKFRLLAYNEAWWPLQTVAFRVRAEQCIGAELKEVTAVLKAKFADHSLKEIQIFESNTRRSLAV